ncbi:MAG: hypothetical protein H6581_09370 [Bacteroidia bacterium]|nr:hypothetical protein [Bacteroidia bacterium]
MKSTITENGAAVMVLDSVFKQADSKFPEIGDNLNNLLTSGGSQPLNPGFAQFAFTIAVAAVNLRAAYDIFPREKAERLFVHTMRIFEIQLKNPQHLAAVTNTIRKYITAYNEGIASIHNPLDHVANQLYYNMGLKNVSIGQGASRSIAAAPNIVKYLATSLLSFTGKWDAMNSRYEILDPDQEQI